ncbi:tRNA guanosine(34) transglycosylase Tgt [Amorphus sp. 3PC139-8]|uniref:tRNA guanosine(34) transglycosylase Tgt n=1 Tax=Amorphus sp. 3PC139-8 TaxID=2735676 RepID=UPI00345D9C6B
MTQRFSFELLAGDGTARRGRIQTPHGLVETPAFMPVGTQATVKTMLPEHVRETGADVVLGNVYHLMLRPGAERIDRLGGLHRFMNWPHTILTDSGGFQVMSLAALRKLDNDGVTFKSHIDGSMHRLTPERSVEIQGLLGSDIQMQLDECVRLPASREEIARGMRLSLDWAERSRSEFERRGGPEKGQGLFGIVQGGDDHALRAESANALAAMPFEGYSIGGLAVGEPQEVMFEMTAAVTACLPTHKPRYLMGVGTPDDLIGSVERGVDMFDCVMPTRAGRHGVAYTRFGKLNLKNARHAEEIAPLDPEGPTEVSRSYSRAYLHHLIRAGETLGAILLTWNNIAYYQALMRRLRAAIEAGGFAEEAAAIRAEWERGDPVGAA